MKNVLVISDNSRLTKYFKSEIVGQNIGELAKITYQYTMANNSPTGMIKLGATPVNIKDPRSVENVINLYDLVISLHCKQIFPSDLVTSITCINVHPGFNPYNRGWYSQVFSILNKKPAGATIHIMDEEVDHGAIIDQIKVDVHLHDTSLDVYEKIIAAEKTLIRKNIYRLMNKEFSTIAPEFEGNFNSRDDFKELCELDLHSVNTLGSHIDLLRALSHGEFKNAYFYDDSGGKIYIHVTLTEESSATTE